MGERAITLVKAAATAATATAAATAAADGQPAEITPQQARAIGLLAGGKTATEAAAGAGVSRMTLYRWMRDDPAFVAAWNAWQRDQRQATQAQLLGITGEAVMAIRGALQQGDGRLALAMLKSMGLLAEQPAGSEDPELVGKQLDLARREEVLTVQKRDFEVFLQELGDRKG